MRPFKNMTQKELNIFEHNCEYTVASLLGVAEFFKRESSKYDGIVESLQDIANCWTTYHASALMEGEYRTAITSLIHYKGEDLPPEVEL